MADLHGVHHVALTVTDLDTSVAWYAEVLGFTTDFREDGDERRACIMRVPGAGYQLALVEHVGAADTGFDARRTGLDHLAFTVESRERLDEWAARLRDLEVETSGAIDVPPGAILNFKDPDGIALSLFWPRT